MKLKISKKLVFVVSFGIAFACLLRKSAKLKNNSESLILIQLIKWNLSNVFYNMTTDSEKENAIEFSLWERPES